MLINIDVGYMDVDTCSFDSKNVADCPTDITRCIIWMLINTDVGYMDDDSYRTLVPTAWIPMLDADEKNGCLQVI